MNKRQKMTDHELAVALRRCAQTALSVSGAENRMLALAADRLEELTRPARLLTLQETMDRAKRGGTVYAEGADGECAWLALSGQDDDEWYLAGYDGCGAQWPGSYLYMTVENVDTGECRPAQGAWRPWSKEPTEEQRRETPWT